MARSSSRVSTDELIQKRVPKNPKYENVKPTIDTGASLTRYMKKIEEIRTNYRYRKDEIFKRMKLTTFVQLALQVAEINSVNNDAVERPYTGRTDDELAGLEGEDTARDGLPDTGRSADTARSTLHSVISGIGEVDVNSIDEPSHHDRGDIPDTSLPYLLLDLRDSDEYEQCHIITALSYPSAMLSRAQNFETREMLEFRNKAGRIIVVYDEDERIAPRCAETLVQRGYDNLFLLSGGLKLALKIFPDGLVTGTPPLSALPTPAPGATRGSKRGAPATPAVRQLPDRDTFLGPDLHALHSQLDAVLDDKSVGNRSSARLSKSSASSRASSQASQQSARSNYSSISERPPFK